MAIPSAATGGAYKVLVEGSPGPGRITAMSLSDLFDLNFGSDGGSIIIRDDKWWQGLQAFTSPVFPMIAFVQITGVLATTGGAIASWHYSGDLPVAITRVTFISSSVSTESAAVDIGTAADATTSSDNLIDGLDVNSAVVCADNITDKGSNGKSRQLLAVGEYITVTGSADTRGLNGAMYIEYLLP